MLAIHFQFSIYASNRRKYAEIDFEENISLLYLHQNRTIRLVIPRHGIRIYRVPLLGIARSFSKQIALKSYRCRYVKSLGEAYCSKLRRERKECTSEIRRGITASLARSRFILEGENLISY